MANDIDTDIEFKEVTQNWYLLADKNKYSYQFTWMGIPIIQYPQDIMAMQEIIFKVKPDLIIETGIAHGGSIIFYAAMLKLLGGKRKVLGIDIDIRKHNREKIEQHPMFEQIIMLEGSSVATDIVGKVYKIAKNYNTILLALDSNHTKDHVLAELNAYAKLIKPPSYIIVFDTRIEWTPKNRFNDRPWGPKNSPMTAVQEFLQINDRFKINHNYDEKLQISECPNGYLRCIK